MRSRTRLALALLLASLLFVPVMSSCDEEEIKYKFAQKEYVTTVGVVVKLRVTQFQTDKPDQSARDYTEGVQAWIIEYPEQGASVSRDGLFTATKPGSYSVKAILAGGECSTTVTVTGAAENINNGSSPHDAIQGFFEAKLEPVSCSSASPNRTRSSQAADLLFSVSGEEVKVDITASNGTHTYAGRVAPDDGTFNISVNNSTSTTEVTGTFSNLGVDGVWKTTSNDGDVCTQPFHGGRR